MIEEVNEEQFTTLLQTKQTIAAFFHTPFCGTCSLARQMVEGALQTLKLDEEKLVVACNLNMMPHYAETFKVMTVPSLYLFKGGHVVDRLVVFGQRDELYYILTKLVD